MGNKGSKPTAGVATKKGTSKQREPVDTRPEVLDQPDSEAVVIEDGNEPFSGPPILPNGETALPSPKAALAAAASSGAMNIYPGGASAGADAFATDKDVTQQLLLDGKTSSKLNTKVCKEDFINLKVIGKGSFGKVLQVQKIDTGAIYAMKILKKAQLVARKQVAHTKTERKVLEDIDHPFIVSLRFAFQTEDKLYMILDYFSGGELFFHLKNSGRFSEERAKFYAAEITLALECLHEHDIVYRDLKPENVLLDEDGHIRLTDFGLSKDAVGSGQLTHTFCGTPEYLAPEVIHGGGYGQAVDWWSLGTLLYEMLTGLPPFYSNNLNVMYEKIISAKLEFPVYFSDPTKRILKAFLERDPRDRIGSDGDGKEIKQHPFFRDIDWVKLYNKQINPPFRPNSDGAKSSTSNIDEEFLNEVPRDTPTAPSQIPVKVEFDDFSFRGAESVLPPSSFAVDDAVGSPPQSLTDTGSFSPAGPAPLAYSPQSAPRPPESFEGLPPVDDASPDSFRVELADDLRCVSIDDSGDCPSP